MRAVRIIGTALYYIAAAVLAVIVVALAGSVLWAHNLLGR